MRPVVFHKNKKAKQETDWR